MRKAAVPRAVRETEHAKIPGKHGKGTCLCHRKQQAADVGRTPRMGNLGSYRQRKVGSKKSKRHLQPTWEGQRSKSQMRAATVGRAGQPRERRQPKAGRAGWGLTRKSAGGTTGKATSETQEGNPGPSQQGDRAGQREGMKSHKEEQREGWSWAERDSGTSRERSLETEERWLACVRGG